MPKNKAASSLHQPLSAVLGTQGKLAVLRVLAKASTPLPHREVVRRTGMAYRTIDLALTDLLVTGVVEELVGGRERRVAMRPGHRLAPVIAALLRAEADFFPSLRTELKAVAAGGERDGLLSVSIVGATASREEALGEPVELVLVSADQLSADRWLRRFEQAAETLGERFGVRFRLIGYDLPGARRLWSSRTPRAETTVAGAELLVGLPMIQLLEGAAG